MYIPTAFIESDLARLHDFIEQNSFGILTSLQDGIPFATHLPFLLDRDAGSQGTLIGHMARANPQWQQAGGQTVLAVFSGPHSYVSPSWYEAEHVVPTWNYVAVHVYGQLQVIDDPDSLLRIVEDTVQTYEKSMPRPWSLGGVDTFVDRLLAQIVGFRISVDKIEGKWKLNQNHPVERRQKVANALHERKTENATAIADLILQTLPPNGE